MRQSIAVFFLLFVTGTSIQSAHIPHDGPAAPNFNQTYVAVLTQPSTVFNIIQKDFEKTNSYTAASYVQYVEQTGSQALIVPWDLPMQEMIHILEQTNGLVLPGGAADDTHKNAYTDRTYAIYQWAMQRNTDGYHYFIWAVCQGFEQMLIMSANNDFSVLDKGFADHTEHEVKIVDDQAWKRSKLFGRMNYYKAAYAFSRRDMLYGHEQGITPEDF